MAGGIFGGLGYEPTGWDTGAYDPQTDDEMRAAGIARLRDAFARMPGAPDFFTQQMVQPAGYTQPPPPAAPPRAPALDAIGRAAGPPQGFPAAPSQVFPASPAMGPLMPAARGAVDTTKDDPWNSVGDMFTGIGASLMSAYDPKGGAVLADIQKQHMAARQKPGKYALHYDPATGQVFRIDNQTGEISAVKTEVPDPYTKKYQEQNAEAWVKRNSAIIDEASKANIAKGDAAQLKQLLDNPAIYQGPGAQAFLTFKAAVNNAFPGTFAGVDDAQLVNAIGNKMALELRNPALGGGMPGSLSDSDRKFLASMPPGLANTRDANMKIADYWSRLAQRAQDIEGLRDAYVSKFGKLDDNFQKVVSAYAAQNHLFGGESWNVPAAASTKRPPLDSFRIK